MSAYTSPHRYLNTSIASTKSSSLTTLILAVSSSSSSTYYSTDDKSLSSTAASSPASVSSSSAPSDASISSTYETSFSTLVAILAQTSSSVISSTSLITFTTPPVSPWLASPAPESPTSKATLTTLNVPADTPLITSSDAAFVPSMPGTATMAAVPGASSSASNSTLVVNSSGPSISVSVIIMIVMVIMGFVTPMTIFFVDRWLLPRIKQRRQRVLEQSAPAPRKESVSAASTLSSAETAVDPSDVVIERVA